MKVCPYCFDDYDLRQVHWRCSDLNGVHCKFEPDTILGEYRGRPTEPMAHTFEVKGHAWWPRRTARCPNGQLTRTRICPHCHNTLPHNVEQVSDDIVGIYGARQSGKTQYIATVVDSLGDEVLPAMDLQLCALSEETIRRRRAMHARLWGELRCLEFTRIAPNADPLMFGVRGAGKFRQNLILYDTAGEAFGTNLEKRDTLYLLRARGLAILLDPFQIPVVRQVLGSQGVEMPPLVERGPAELVAQFVRDYMRVTPQGRGRRIDIPVALTVTKIDALLKGGLLDKSHPVASPARYDGGFHVKEHAQVAGYMREKLLEWEQAQLVKTVDLYFRDHTFCGVSALGQNPRRLESDMVLDREPAPLRVADPFIWLLARLGTITAR